MNEHKQWTPQEDRRLLELINAGCTQLQTAEKLTKEFNAKITRNAVKNRLQIIKNGEHIKSKGNLFPDYCYNAYKEHTHIDDKIERMKEIYNMFTGQKLFIISFSDVHSPLIDFFMIENVLRKHERTMQQKRNEWYTVTILLNGDIFDFSQMSKFSKGKFRVNVSREIKLATELINVCCDIADYVLALLGNHDVRLYKYIEKIAEKEPEIIDYLEENLDPLKKIKHNNFEYINHMELQLGRMVFVHPFGYNKPILKTVQNVKDALVAHKDMLPNPNIQGVCMGHTHQLGTYIENDILLMEQGHSSHDPDYRLERKTARKWVKGYGIIQIDEEGNIDLEETRAIPYVNPKEIQVMI